MGYMNASLAAAQTWSAQPTSPSTSITYSAPQAQQVTVTPGPSNLTYMGAPLAAGGSMVMPSVQYGLANPSGSVEVPVYGGSVDVQRMYQTYAAAAPAIQAPSPVQVSTMSGMTAEQLKFIFPHGAPAKKSSKKSSKKKVSSKKKSKGGCC